MRQTFFIGQQLPTSSSRCSVGCVGMEMNMLAQVSSSADSLAAELARQLAVIDSLIRR